MKKANFAFRSNSIYNLYGGDSMKNKWIQYVYILIGIGIIGLWIMLLMTDQVPEIETALAEIIMHILIEISLGIMCIISGVMLLKKFKNAHYFCLLTNGLLIYSVVNSSGYYIQSGDFIMVMIFALLLLLALYFSIKIIHHKN